MVLTLLYFRIIGGELWKELVWWCNKSNNTQLDKVVYGLISIFYDIILKLAEINVFKEGAVEDTATRLYTLIGLFMLFKVSFLYKLHY